MFVVSPIYGDLITTNVTDGCSVDTLGITDNVFIIAKYEPMQITCSSGQYLPANSVNCSSCPNEATCTPGTYSFNETRNQGIVYNNPFQQNKTSGCAQDLLGIESNVKIVAKYEPNTINLRWYSVGDTVFETSQCTYGDTITLPATNPTRPGYIFAGWQLRPTPAE